MKLFIYSKVLLSIALFLFVFFSDSLLAQRDESSWASIWYSTNYELPTTNCDNSSQYLSCHLMMDPATVEEGEKIVQTLFRAPETPSRSPQANSSSTAVNSFASDHNADTTTDYLGRVLASNIHQTSVAQAALEAIDTRNIYSAKAASLNQSHGEPVPIAHIVTGGEMNAFPRDMVVEERIAYAQAQAEARIKEVENRLIALENSMKHAEHHAFARDAATRAELTTERAASAVEKAERLKLVKEIVERDLQIAHQKHQELLAEVEKATSNHKTAQEELAKTESTAKRCALAIKAATKARRDAVGEAKAVAEGQESEALAADEQAEAEVVKATEYANEMATLRERAAQAAQLAQENVEFFNADRVAIVEAQEKAIAAEVMAKEAMMIAATTKIVAENITIPEPLREKKLTEARLVAEATYEKQAASRLAAAKLIIQRELQAIEERENCWNTRWNDLVNKFSTAQNEAIVDTKKTWDYAHAAHAAIDTANIKLATALQTAESASQESLAAQTAVHTMEHSVKPVLEDVQRKFVAEKVATIQPAQEAWNAWVVEHTAIAEKYRAAAVAAERYFAAAATAYASISKSSGGQGDCNGRRIGSYAAYTTAASSAYEAITASAAASVRSSLTAAQKSAIIDTQAGVLMDSYWRDVWPVFETERNAWKSIAATGSCWNTCLEQMRTTATQWKNFHHWHSLVTEPKWDHSKGGFGGNHNQSQQWRNEQEGNFGTLARESSKQAEK
ncbi:MAG TPA: hypothetical protein VJK54_09405, partial [Chthoniobacterales bacterium]|nr:hypothetical protein [Chthoniobacterales bacterium]